jgi:hypothetical protein
MSLLKQYRLAEKAAAHQQRVIAELQTLTKSIVRSEKTITDLKAELEAVNLKHAGRKTTQEDIDYLSDLLRCANKKLGWEKQLASLWKRAPAVLQNVSTVMQDPKNPPTDEMRAALLGALQDVKVAMERLDKVRMD